MKPVIRESGGIEGVHHLSLMTLLIELVWEKGKTAMRRRSGHISQDGGLVHEDGKAVLTTAELSLHPYHEAKAGGVATPNNPRHSAHRPGTEEGRDEPQTVEKTTAGQRARPVHQVPPRTCQAKLGPLRAVLQKDPRIRSQEKSRSQTGQVYRGVSLSHRPQSKEGPAQAVSPFCRQPDRPARDCRCTVLRICGFPAWVTCAEAHFR